MARVPRYVSGAQLQQLPGVQVRSFETDESLGGGVGAAVSGIASQAAQRANAIAVMDAERKAKETRLNLLFNQESGAYQIKGKSALALSSQVSASLDKTLNDIEAGLSTPAQKAMFRQRVADMIPSTQAELNRYGVEQARAYEAEATKAYKQTAASEAATYYNNPEKIQEQVRKVWDANLIEYQDSSPEVLERANRVDQSAIYTAAMSRMIDDNPLLAEKFYEESRDLFVGEDQARVERALKPKVLQYKAFAKADDIISSGGSLTDWRQEARKITDLNEREIVMARLKEEDSIRKMDKQRAEEAARDGAWGHVLNGGSLRTMPAELQASLDPVVRKQIMGYELGRAEGKDVATDWAVYEELQSMPPAELAKTDLTKYYSQLNEAERKQLIQKKANAQKGITQIKPELTFEQQFTDTAPSMLFPATSKKDKALTREQKEVLGRLRAQVAAEVTQAETAKGGYLTMEERQKIIDRHVMQQWRETQTVEVDRGGFFDTKVKVSEVKPDEWMAIDFDDTDLPPIQAVPASSQNAIRSYAQSKGVTISEEQIQRVYLLSQVGAPDEAINAVLGVK